LRRAIIPNVKIAVVDPDPLTRDFVVNVMMYSVNREVMAFENSAGLKAYLTAGGALDLVLVEIQLPDGNGLDLLDTVRNEHPKTIRVAISSRPGDENRAKQKNVHSFLAKPFTLTDLFAIVQLFVVEGTS
jgi:CheY-like chemotaxis protein